MVRAIDLTSFVNDSVRALCKELGESIVSQVLSNDAADFKSVQYSGQSITPVSILNSRIAKNMYNLLNGNGELEESLERDLIKSLLIKNAGVLLAKAMKEAEERKTQIEKAKEKLEKEKEELTANAKKLANDPEVKKRRRRKVKESVDMVTAADEHGQQIAVPQESAPTQSIPQTEVVEDMKLPETEENPFHELDKVVSQSATPQQPTPVKPTVEIIDDFLAQEKLKALNALNDEPSI